MKRAQDRIISAGLSVFLALSLSGCFRPGSGAPGPVIVRVEADKKEVAIGDKIKYTITIEKSKGVEVEFPSFAQGFGIFAVKDFGSKKSALPGREKISQWYILDTYITGKTSIPKAVIKYREKGNSEWGQIESVEIPIEVKSVLEHSGPSAQMRDIKGPVAIGSPLKRLLLFLLLLFLAGAGLLSGYFLKKKSEKQSAARKPAHEIAYEQLEALKAKDYISRGLIKEYYTEISDITRHYLENRFNLKAPEMTTEEFLASARDSSELSDKHKELLKEFLLCCDLVKFARYAPTADEINSIYTAARNFVDQTKENDPA